MDEQFERARTDWLGAISFEIARDTRLDRLDEDGTLHVVVASEADVEPMQRMLQLVFHRLDNASPINSFAVEVGAL